MMDSAAASSGVDSTGESLARRARWKINPASAARTVPITAIMQKIAPFAAGATVESEPPMQTAQAFAAEGASAMPNSAPVETKCLGKVFT